MSPKRVAEREPGLTDELHTLGALLRIPLDVLIRHVYAELARSGHPDVRLAHGAVFRHISRGGSRVSVLAQRAGMTKQSMAELVEHLRARGYLELVPDPEDGRARLVRLTAAGWRVHHKLVRISQDFERQCARALGEERWATLRSLLTEFAAWSLHYRVRG